MMPLLCVVVLVACATFFYRAAEFENESAGLWAGLSVLTFLVTWMVLGWGLFLSVAGQVALFIGIAVVRAVRTNRQTR
jgi:hypothetical protein